MTAVLALSVALGLAYNRASPLGVRRTSPQSSVPSDLNLYANETLSVGWRPRGESQALQGAYRNETVAISLAHSGGVPPGKHSARLAQPSIPSAAPSPTKQKPLTEISWPAVKTLLQAGRLLVVDARGHLYYQAEHIPGAVSLPFNASEAELTAFKAKYPTSTPMVVYCANAACSLAHRLAGNLLTEHGYSTVMVLAGGYLAWRLAESDPTARPPGSGAARPN